MTSRKYQVVAALTVILASGLWVTGCNKSPESGSAASTSASSATASASTESRVNQIQSNPNIPPQAKARIIANMQGKGGAPAPPPGPGQ